MRAGLVLTIVVAGGVVVAVVGLGRCVLEQQVGVVEAAKSARGERSVKGISPGDYDEEGFQERSDHGVAHATNGNGSFPLLDIGVVVREGHQKEIIVFFLGHGPDPAYSTEGPLNVFEWVVAQCAVAEPGTVFRFD